MRASGTMMDVWLPGIVLELRMELLLVVAMIGFAMMNYCRPRPQADKLAKWQTGGKLRQISKAPLKKPDNHEKRDEGICETFDKKSCRGQEAGVTQTSVHHPRLCMILDEIMEVTPLNFNRNGTEHAAPQWGKQHPKFRNCFDNESSLEVDPQFLGERLTKEAADYNLRLFDELSGLLDQDGVNVMDIARITNHSVLRFYNTMLQSCIKLNNKDKMTEVLTHLAKYKIPRNASFCEGVLKQLAGANWAKEALHIYPLLTSDGFAPSAVMCSCMICFAADCGQHETAKHFYSQLCSVATPNLRTFMTMLKVHSKRGDWQASLAVFREMQARNVKIDSHVLNMVMGICASAGMPHEVEQLLAEAEAGDSVFVLPDVVSYNTLVKAYGLHGHFPNAVEVLSRMRARGLEANAITYNSLIDAAARTGEAAAAWEFYQEMVKQGFPGDKYTCSILTKTLSPNPTCDRIRMCLDLVHEIAAACDVKLRTRLYHSTIEAALQLGDSTVLIRSFSQARQHRVRPTAAACRQLKELATSARDPVAGHWKPQ